MTTTLPRRRPGASLERSRAGEGPEPSEGGDADRPRRRRRRRDPALDGLRGVAVLAVLLYHGGVDVAAGGYLGVDAFFVLSGFLITRLLLDEGDDRGDVDLGAFWIRRLRRLVPPVLLALAAVAALCLVLDPAVIGPVRGDALAALGWVMNWRLIAESASYFDQFSVSPLQHLWSLAVEEQFYLVWPLVIVGLRRAGLGARAVLVTALGLAAGSATWMIVSYQPDLDPSRLYYGTDTRAQALLIGAALAAALALGLRVPPGAMRRWLVRAASVGAALVVVAWTALPGTAPVLYRGGFTVLALLVALVVLASTRLGDHPLRRLLSVTPLRALGLVSYGVYLYHVPIFIWLNAERTGLDPDSLALLGLRLAVTLLAASVSYRFIERPAVAGRLDRLAPTPALGPALAPAAVVAVLALLGASTSRAVPGLAPVAGRGAPTAAAGDQSRVLLVGDSVAYTLAVGLEGPVSEQHGLAVWNDAVLFCELLPYPRREGGLELPASHTCDGWETRWRREVAEFRPALAVLQVGAWEVFDRVVDGREVPFGSAESDRLIDEVLDRAADALGSGGAPVAVVTTPPLRRDDGTNAREWTQNETRRTDHFNQRLRVLADRHAGVHVIDLATYLCPGDVCRAEIDGAHIRPDGVHFGPTDGPVVAAWLAGQLRALVPSHP